MAEVIETLILKPVELHNQGLITTLHEGLVYPLPEDVHRFLVRIGTGLPFKSYHPKASSH